VRNEGSRSAQRGAGPFPEHPASSPLWGVRFAQSPQPERPEGDWHCRLGSSDYPRPGVRGLPMSSAAPRSRPAAALRAAHVRIGSLWIHLPRALIGRTLRGFRCSLLGGVRNERGRRPRTARPRSFASPAQGRITFSACRPFGPRLTSNSTSQPSSKLL
jgi:hypothetical protein